MHNPSPSHWMINGEIVEKDEKNEFECEFDFAENAENGKEMEVEEEGEHGHEHSSLLSLLIRSLENALQQIAIAEISFLLSAFQVIETSKHDKRWPNRNN